MDFSPAPVDSPRRRPHGKSGNPPTLFKIYLIGYESSALFSPKTDDH